MKSRELRLVLANKLRAIAFCLIAVVYGSVEAMPISINLGSAPNITSHVTASFSDLNGTPLQGQTLSLDFLFAGGQFARLFSVTNPSFAALITLHTSGAGVVGFLDGTGSLLDQTGNTVGMAEFLGSASDNEGSMSVALFPLLSGDFSAPLDFFGIHTSLLLPINLPVTVTGGDFQLISAGATPQDVFGIGPGIPRDIVPESGSTLLLLSATFFAFFATAGRVFPIRRIPWRVTANGRQFVSVG